MLNCTSANVGGNGCAMQVADDANVRLSAGASIIWNSPFGPLRFNFAYPILKNSYDRTQFFQFGGGTHFKCGRGTGWGESMPALRQSDRRLTIADIANLTGSRLKEGDAAGRHISNITTLDSVVLPISALSMTPSFSRIWRRHAPPPA